MTWWNKAGCPIGIDFGAHSIKLLQLKASGEGYAVAAAASRPVPAPLPEAPAERAELISNLIRQMLDTGGFTGNRVVSCLPAGAVQYKSLRLPRMPADELRAAVEWEAADRLKLASGSAHLQFFDAGEVRQGEELRREIILLAASHQAVDEHLDILTRAELSPIAVDVVPSAMARCLGYHLPQDNEPGTAHVAVDVGFSSSKVLVIRDGEVSFFKLIDIGGQKLNQTMATHLNLPVADAAELRRRLQESSKANGTPGGDEQLFGSTRRESLERAVFEALRTTIGELAKEVALCLRYYSVTFRGKRPTTLLLMGGEAYEPQVSRVLAEGADIQVEAVEPLAGMDLSGAPLLAESQSKHCEWGIAAGLSMRTASAANKRGAA